MKKELTIGVCILGFILLVLLWAWKFYLPECYITNEICIVGYDNIGIGGSEYYQCCRPPEYLLQGIHYQLMNDILYKNSIIQEALWIYNCSLEKENQVRCWDASNCFDNPDLEGCYKPDRCNWCCRSFCTLVGCMSDDIN